MPAYVAPNRSDVNRTAPNPTDCVLLYTSLGLEYFEGDERLLGICFSERWVVKMRRSAGNMQNHCDMCATAAAAGRSLGRVAEVQLKRGRI